MAELITIEIPCKPYVKRYLEYNCNTPADLKKLPDVWEQFMLQLKTKSMRFNHRKFQYPDLVEVIIPENLFYRYGWELTKTGVYFFNKYSEEKVKFVMRNFVATNKIITGKVATAIRMFQETFGFDEDTWSYESIKKDYQRNEHKAHIKAVKEIRMSVTEVFTDNMVDMKMVTRGYQEKILENAQDMMDRDLKNYGRYDPAL